MIPRALADMAENHRDRTPKVSARQAAIRYFGPEHCIAWHGNVQIILSAVAPTMPAMAEMAEQLDNLGSKCPGGIGCLLIIRSDVSPPAEDVRRFIAIKLERSPMLAAAQVVLGTGFRGAAMRSMLSVLQLAIRPKFAMKIFGDVAQGSAWLTNALGERGAQSLGAAALTLTAQEIVTQFF